MVHPAPGHEDGTLVNALLAHCDDLRGIGGELRPGIVHRIDKDTSGLLVVAKDDQTMKALGAAFKAHDIERIYEALVVGKPPAESGRIDTLHGRDPRDRKKFSIRVKEGRARGHRLAGRRAFQRRGAHGGASWRPGARTRCACTWRRSGARCSPTATYGKPPRDPALRAIADELGRQALHARTLGFVHPATGKTMSFTSEPPRGLTPRARGAAGARMIEESFDVGGERLPLVRSALIPARFHHGFTTRRGGVSAPPFDTLNLGMKWGDARAHVIENRRRLQVATGVERIFVARQVHGAAVLQVSAGDVPADVGQLEADGLFSDAPDIARRRLRRRLHPGARWPTTRTGAFAAVHAGWRGTLAGVVPAAVRRMVDELGVRPRDLRVALGPAIGVCCFEVGEEVVDAVARAMPDARWRRRRARSRARRTAARTSISSALNVMLLAARGRRRRRRSTPAPSARAATARASSPTAATRARPARRSASSAIRVRLGTWVSARAGLDAQKRERRQDARRRQ